MINPKIFHYFFKFLKWEIIIICASFAYIMPWHVANAALTSNYTGGHIYTPDPVALCTSQGAIGFNNGKCMVCTPYTSSYCTRFVDGKLLTTNQDPNAQRPELYNPEGEKIAEWDPINNEPIYYPDHPFYTPPNPPDIETCIKPYFKKPISLPLQPDDYPFTDADGCRYIPDFSKDEYVKCYGDPIDQCYIDIVPIEPVAPPSTCDDCDDFEEEPATQPPFELPPTQSCPFDEIPLPDDDTPQLNDYKCGPVPTCPSGSTYDPWYNVCINPITGEHSPPTPNNPPDNPDNPGDTGGGETVGGGSGGNDTPTSDGGTTPDLSGGTPGGGDTGQPGTTPGGTQGETTPGDAEEGTDQPGDCDPLTEICTDELLEEIRDAVDGDDEGYINDINDQIVNEQNIALNNAESIANEDVAFDGLNVFNMFNNLFNFPTSSQCTGVFDRTIFGYRFYIDPCESFAPLRSVLAWVFFVFGSIKIYNIFFERRLVGA